jgi:hypothetical protein
MDGTESLASSLAYKGTMKGLSQKGNMMAYMSKDFAELLLKLHGIAKANGMMDALGEQATDLDKVVEELKLIKQGSVNTLSRVDDGILMSERGVKNYQERMKEMDEMMMKMMKEMK